MVRASSLHYEIVVRVSSLHYQIVVRALACVICIGGRQKPAAQVMDDIADLTDEVDE